MKSEDYFQLTLEQRVYREEVLKLQVPKASLNTHTLEDYYKIEDTISFLEKLRTYQINDIMSRRGTSKYKLF